MVTPRQHPEKRLPIATALTVRVHGRDVRIVTVRCPFCRSEHAHGWPFGDLEPGIRASHCGVGALRNYFIPTPLAATLQPAQGVR